MQRLRYLIWLGLAGQLFGYFGLLCGWPVIREWFYPLAWWSYILLLDGIIYRMRGNSLIVSRTKPFLLMLPWSVVIWLVFELANFRLQNWYYVNLESILWLRWIGYTISLATVLPAIFETAEFLEIIGLFRKVVGNPLDFSNRKTRVIFFWSGIITLGLAAIFPQIFFPLIWISFILILEPVNYKLGGHSLLNQGNYAKIGQLAMAGLICGVLWEFWNWHSSAAWVYNLPYFHFWKIFEMPLLGYLGFLPFGWESYLMYQFVVLNGYGPAWQNAQPPEGEKPVRWLMFATYLFLAIFCLSMFYLLDTRTVKGLFS